MLLGGLGVTILLAGCGSSSTASNTTSPSGSSLPAPTSSVATSSSTTSSSAGPTGPQNLVATAADKSALTAAFVTYKKVPAQDIAGTAPGTVYYAYVPSTGTYWALASFLPTSTASQQTEVGLQDGGGMGIFTKHAGGTWTMVATGSFPFCPSQTVIPSAVRTVWGLSDSGSCSAQG